MKDEIINLYLQGYTNKYIATCLGLHRTTVQRVLKRSNVPLRMQLITSRKTNILNFHGEIVTNNDAYLLGLIWSDGNLYRNCIDISLQYTDKQILSDVSHYVYGYEKLTLRKTKTKDQYRFLITSKDVVTRLKSIGLLERKSLICRMPLIDTRFYSHFIRGVFDGDGCIFISKKYKNTNRVTIVSNYAFCNDLKVIIENSLNINAKVNTKTKNIGCVSISGNHQIKIFMNWIYQHASLKLDRKYQKFINEFYPVNDAIGNAEALLKMKDMGLKIPTK